MQARGATLSWFGSVDASNISSGVGTITITGSFRPNFPLMSLPTV